MKTTLLAVLLTLAATLQAQVLVDYQELDFYTTADLQAVAINFGVPPSFVDLDYAVRTYKVTYMTPGVDGNMVTASGAVAIPEAYDCGYPMAAYLHGTVFNKENVPSRENAEYLFNLLFASAGQVITMPDYLGLGDAPGLHPYVHADTEASASLDMIRATYEMTTELGIGVSDELMIFGYSQGGHSAMALHREIERNHMDEFNLVAVAPSSGPYDISGVQTQYITGDDPYATPGYLPYVVLSYDMVYGLYDSLSQVFASPFDETIPPLFDGTNSSTVVNSSLPSVPKAVLDTTFFNDFVSNPDNSMRVALRDNDVYDFTPTVPTALFYCSGDDQVAPANTTVALASFQDSGATTVIAQDLGPFDHGGCFPFALLSTADFFEQNSTAPVQLLESAVVADATGGTTEDGSITLTAAAGTTLTYAWDDAAMSTTASLDNLNPGTYSVTITNDGGCSIVARFDVGNSVSLTGVATSAFEVYPNPVRGGAFYLELPTAGVHTLTVYDLSGRMVARSQVHDATQAVVAPRQAGVYLLQLRDSEGRTYRSKLVVE